MWNRILAASSTSVRWSITTLVLQTQFQELIWSRDRIHWHRFDEGRIPWLSNGPVGTFDAGFANNLAEYYSFTNSEGEGRVVVSLHGESGPLHAGCRQGHRQETPCEAR